MQVNYADYREGIFGDSPNIYTEFRIEASSDGAEWREIARTTPPRRDRPNAYIELPRAERAQYVRFVHEHIGGPNLAIAELRLFGTDAGPRPAAPKLTVAKRQQDTRNPDRLMLTYQKFADQLPDPARPSLELRALNAGVPYYVAVESFDERGVSRLSRVMAIR